VCLLRDSVVNYVTHSLAYGQRYLFPYEQIGLGRGIRQSGISDNNCHGD
jgi:hypothetical protein